MYAVMLACTKTLHSPKTDEPTRRFPSIMLLEKTFEVAEKPSSLGNKCKRQMGEPLPTCQGLWGMLHQKSRLYRQVWQFPTAMCSNRLGKVRPVAISSSSFFQSWSHCTYLVSLVVLHGQFHSQINLQINIFARK